MQTNDASRRVKYRCHQKLTHFSFLLPTRFALKFREKE